MGKVCKETSEKRKSRKATQPTTKDSAKKERRTRTGDELLLVKGNSDSEIYLEYVHRHIVKSILIEMGLNDIEVDVKK